VPPAGYPGIRTPQGRVSPIATGVAGVIAGAAIGAGVMASKTMEKTSGQEAIPAAAGSDEEA
jgi:hypothetical protein